MHPDSLCRLCSDPSKCPLCDVVRNPRPLTMRSIGAISSGRCAPAPRVTRTVDVTPVTPTPYAQTAHGQLEARQAAVAASRQAALRAEIEATKAEIARLSQRVTVPVYVPASPASVNQATVPTAPPPVKLAPLAPAPAALPAPAAVVRFPPAFGALRQGDWLGLSARVDAGVLTQADAERIGSEWMAGQGVSARA